MSAYKKWLIVVVGNGGLALNLRLRIEGIYRLEVVMVVGQKGREKGSE